jgi:hypothetical protein
MTPDSSGAGRSVPKRQRGRHRTPRRYQAMLVRTVGVGGVACCVGLIAEVNAPDADALSILLPSGNGNATQINILEGNIIDPQFGLGGNGSNTSQNSTIAKILFGLGNGGTAGTSGGGIFGPIALGGANGNGNVTQINILSYNIFNPQVSLTGNNTSQNTTISNVALGNGNGSKATSATGTGAGTFIGGATGNGNTTQLAFFSGNIFNPQFSLFGNNTSNNTAITNISGLNGNKSTTNATGGFFGTGLFGMTGNGNTDQTAVGVSNIINPQFSLLGTNLSRNYANANQATGNGGGAGNSVSSTGGLGNIFGVGETGNGNTTQNATGSGNIYNDQWRLGLGNFLPALPGSQDEKETPAPLTNSEVTSGSAGTGQSGPLTEAELLALQNQQQGTTSSTGITGAPGPLKAVADRLKNAVDDTIDRITKPLKPKATSTAGSATTQQDPSTS